MYKLKAVIYVFCVVSMALIGSAHTDRRGQGIKVITDVNIKLVAFANLTLDAIEDCALLCLDYDTQCLTMKYYTKSRLCSLVTIDVSSLAAYGEKGVELQQILMKGTRLVFKIDPGTPVSLLTLYLNTVLLCTNYLLFCVSANSPLKL